MTAGKIFVRAPVPTHDDDKVLSPSRDISKKTWLIKGLIDEPEHLNGFDFYFHA